MLRSCHSLRNGRTGTETTLIFAPASSVASEVGFGGVCDLHFQSSIIVAFQSLASAVEQYSSCRSLIS
jgi:hypothetical protein